MVVRRKYGPRVLTIFLGDKSDLIMVKFLFMFFFRAECIPYPCICHDICSKHGVFEFCFSLFSIDFS